MEIRDRLRRLVVGGEEETGPIEGKYASVVIVFSQDYNLLFVKRMSSEHDPWSGQIAFPGGRWREGDSSLLETASRELYEETGLRMFEDVELIGFMHFVRPGNIPELRVRPYIAVKLNEDAELRPGSEVESLLWIPLRVLRREVVDVYSRSRGVMRVLAYRHGDVVIWGMTARILSTITSALEPL